MLHYFDEKEIQIETEKGTVVALGKFDGFHQGHMLLLAEVLRLQKDGYTGVIFTFDIRENAVFQVSNMKNIMTSDEKYEFTKNLGVDIFIEYPFDDEFASMEPETFVKDILVDRLHAKYVVVGTDFGFGRNKRGNVKLLQELENRYGYQVLVLEKKKIDDKIVSSTYIRELVKNGKMEDVTKFLGRPYLLSGHVVHGKELGRTIQVPTANLLPQRGKLYPAAGVYASKIQLENGSSFYGITNIGDNPTVSSDSRVTIETHIFDFDADIYEQKISVELLHFIRGEKKFAGIPELKQQMDADIQTAKRLL